MEAEWVKQKIKEAHETAVEKEFYDCEVCKDDIPSNAPDVKLFGKIPCNYCNGTGKDQNRNIGELLMLIVSELGEAINAHRKNKFAEMEKFLKHSSDNKEMSPEWVVCFCLFIKDTFEDELADVFIRLFDLCGYLQIELKELIFDFSVANEKNNVCRLYLIGRELPSPYLSYEYFESQLSQFFVDMIKYCEDNKVNIKNHIEMKMAYNKTRPKKHGKEY